MIWPSLSRTGFLNAFAARESPTDHAFPIASPHFDLALVVSASPSFDAMAQALGQGAAGLITDQQKVIQGLTAKTDDLEKKIQQDGEDDAALVDIRLQLEDLSRAALDQCAGVPFAAHRHQQSDRGAGPAARRRVSRRSPT